MFRISILALSLIGLSACNDSVAKPAPREKLMGALIEAMCAPTKDELALALGSVADAVSAMPAEEQDGLGITELASDITPSDCPQNKK